VSFNVSTSALRYWSTDQLRAVWMWVETCESVVIQPTGSYNLTISFTSDFSTVTVRRDLLLYTSQVDTQTHTHTKEERDRDRQREVRTQHILFLVLHVLTQFSLCI
jgi:hypothetical protein